MGISLRLSLPQRLPAITTLPHTLLLVLLLRLRFPLRVGAPRDLDVDRDRRLLVDGRGHLRPRLAAIEVGHAIEKRSKRTPLGAPVGVDEDDNFHRVNFQGGHSPSRFPSMM